MKKILVVTTKPPFPLFSGDRLRIYNISKHLSKKNKVDLIYTGSKEKFKKKINFIDKFMFIRTNIIKRIFYTLFFLLKGKPLQVGFFFSQEMKKKIYSIYENYDCIIFHLIRASEFLPKNYKGTTVLEMTDLISENYLQLFKKFSFFNPLRYLYFIEKILLKNYEKKVINYFNHKVLVSKTDKKKFSTKNKLKNKIKIISNGTDLKKKSYKFSKKNKDIIFIGNINYEPNKIACYEFIEKIMPKLEKLGLNVNFKIIGQTSSTLKSRLSNYKNVNVFNNVKSIESLCKNAFCGISNLSVVTGIQNKILEYKRIGLPPNISHKCFESINAKNNYDICVYKNHDEFVKQVLKLKNDKKFAKKISDNCYKKINSYYNWNKSLKLYNKII